MSPAEDQGTAPSIPGGPPRRWAGAEDLPEASLLRAACVGCGQAWMVHPDQGGYRIRCVCSAMVEVPRASPGPPEARPAAPRLRRPVGRLPQRSALEHGQDDHDPIIDDHPRQARAIDRFWLQLLLILGCLVVPRLLVTQLVAGPDQLSLWPYATLLSAALATGLGLIWPGAAFSALRMPAWRWLAGGLAMGLATGGIGLLYTTLWIEHSSSGAEAVAWWPDLPLASAVLVIAVGPAVCEEIAFRGMLQSTLTEAIGRQLGWISTAVCFACCHGITMGFPLQLGMGVLLGWLRIRCGSLLPGMLIHFAYNGVLVMAMHHARSQ